MKTVSEVSRMSGVSVRTLHHYDAIGLLKPAQVTEAGYRLYDDAALARLHTILLFRELAFPLGEIRRILDTPGFDPRDALADQIRMLELQRERLDTLIAHTRQIQETGVIPMNFKPYDSTKLDAYAAEAKARWGHTDAWKESQEKSQGRTREQQTEVNDGLMDIFRRLGTLRDRAPEDAQVQAMVEELRQYICTHFYNCTPQILRGLGQMYAAGDEMTENIDKAGGPGTGRFACAAIEIYCR